MQRSTAHHLTACFLSFIGAAAPLLGQTNTAYPGCPPGQMLKSEYEVTSRHDDFENTTSYSGSEITLGDQVDGHGFTAQISQLQSSMKDTFIDFVVMYVGKDWVFISGEQPLLLLVDGQKMSLVPMGTPTRHVWESGSVFEASGYKMTSAQLRKLASAHTVKIRVTGERYIPDFVLSPGGACAIARFTAERVATK